MVVTYIADRAYDFDPDTLPLAVTVHNFTVLLSAFLLATIVAYLICQLYRLRVHFPPLPRLLRNLLWVLFAEPRLAFLPPAVSQTIRMAFFSSMTYLVSRYWMVSSPPAKPSPLGFGGRATLTLSDGSTSTTILSNMHAFSDFLVSSFKELATANWEIEIQAQSSTATPT